MERLNVIITTYDSGDGARYNKLVRTVGALRSNLTCGDIHYIITDDSTPEVYEYAYNDFGSGWDNTTFINTNRKGVGFAKNNALRIAFETSDQVLLTEDDWLLKEPLDIGKHMEVLADNENVGMIRFGFLGGKMGATYTDYGFPKTYWTLHSGSGHYVYSGQVSLRHKRWYDSMGFHDENCQAGEEEDAYCHRFNKFENPPDILWPAEYGSTLNAGAFLNIGMDHSTNAVQV